jgi:hypothetical protein
MTTSSPTPQDLPALPDSVWYSGYDWIGALRNGWDAVASWGRSGWDLGHWPLVIIAHYDHPDRGCYGLAVYIEGDRYVTAYPTREARNQATDTQAAAWWRHFHNGPDDLAASDDHLQPHHRGPFSWSRCQAPTSTTTPSEDPAPAPGDGTTGEAAR